MRDTFDEIRDQVHEIRNLMAPFDLKLSNLDHQIKGCMDSIEKGRASLESRVLENSTKLNEQATKIAATSIRLDELTSRVEVALEEHARILESIRRLEALMKNLPASEPAPAATLAPDDGKPLPVHQDKVIPSVLPPQSPAS